MCFCLREGPKYSGPCRTPKQGLGHITICRRSRPQAESSPATEPPLFSYQPLPLTGREYISERQEDSHISGSHFSLTESSHAADMRSDKLILHGQFAAYLTLYHFVSCFATLVAMKEGFLSPYTGVNWEFYVLLVIGIAVTHIVSLASTCRYHPQTTPEAWQCSSLVLQSMLPFAQAIHGFRQAMIAGIFVSRPGSHLLKVAALLAILAAVLPLSFVLSDPLLLAALQPFYWPLYKPAPPFQDRPSIFLMCLRFLDQQTSPLKQAFVFRQDLVQLLASIVFLFSSGGSPIVALVNAIDPGIKVFLVCLRPRILGWMASRQMLWSIVSTDDVKSVSLCDSVCSWRLRCRSIVVWLNNEKPSDTLQRVCVEEIKHMFERHANDTNRDDAVAVADEVAPVLLRMLLGNDRPTAVGCLRAMSVHLYCRFDEESAISIAHKVHSLRENKYVDILSVHEQALLEQFPLGASVIAKELQILFSDAKERIDVRCAAVMAFSQLDPERAGPYAADLAKLIDVPEEKICAAAAEAFDKLGLEKAAACAEDISELEAQDAQDEIDCRQALRNIIIIIFIISNIPFLIFIIISLSSSNQTGKD